MQSTKTAVYTAPAVAGRVVEFYNSNDLAPYVVVENLESGVSVPIKFQESDDGTNWTDIANTTTTVSPGDSVGTSVVSSRARIALHAGGNAQILVGVNRTINGAPTSLGSA